MSRPAPTPKFLRHRGVFFIGPSQPAGGGFSGDRRFQDLSGDCVILPACAVSWETFFFVAVLHMGARGARWPRCSPRPSAWCCRWSWCGGGPFRSSFGPAICACTCLILRRELALGAPIALQEFSGGDSPSLLQFQMVVNAVIDCNGPRAGVGGGGKVCGVYYTGARLRCPRVDVGLCSAEHGGGKGSPGPGCPGVWHRYRPGRGGGHCVLCLFRGICRRAASLRDPGPSPRPTTDLRAYAIDTLLTSVVGLLRAVLRTAVDILFL